jgi:sterol desaturase/sphingolipid hydroxylase (fatty acid hydroxylase superfamily)
VVGYDLPLAIIDRYVLANWIVQSVIVYMINCESEPEFGLYEVWKIVPLLIYNDLLFGFFHWIMHTYFPKSHAIHHRLKDEKLIRINAQSSSILDHCFTSLLPPYLSAICAGLNYPFMVLWFVFCEYNSVKSHIFIDGDYNYHVIHHYDQRKHLGTSIGLFDYIMCSN